MSRFLEMANPESKYHEPELTGALSQLVASNYLSTRHPHDLTARVVSYAIKENKSPKAAKGDEILVLEFEVTEVRSGAYTTKGDTEEKPLEPGLKMSHLVYLSPGDKPAKAKKVFAEVASICSALTGEDEKVFLDPKIGYKAIAEAFATSESVGREIVATGVERTYEGKTYYNTRFAAA